MTNEVRFDRDEYAKTYYKEYYKTNKEKINEARRKRITVNRIKTLYGVELNDNLYKIFDENREVYNNLFRQLKKNKQHLITYQDVNPLLVEHFNAQWEASHTRNFVKGGGMEEPWFLHPLFLKVSII